MADSLRAECPAGKPAKESRLREKAPRRGHNRAGPVSLSPGGP